MLIGLSLLQNSGDPSPKGEGTSFMEGDEVIKKAQLNDGR
jgi:hypothetical protein